ncbi:MAG: hypothetical protein V3T23_04735 [Nitrososphaerales archaeon]
MWSERRVLVHEIMEGFEGQITFFVLYVYKQPKQKDTIDAIVFDENELAWELFAEDARGSLREAVQGIALSNNLEVPEGFEGNLLLALRKYLFSEDAKELITRYGALSEKAIEAAHIYATNDVAAAERSVSGD